MRWRMAVPLLLLQACADKSTPSSDPIHGGDTPDTDLVPDTTECAEEAADPAACCQPVEDSLRACTDAISSDALIAGSFGDDGAGSNTWTFTPADPKRTAEGFVVTFSGTLAATLVPDLAALGEVWVRSGGGCASDGEGDTGGVFEIRDRETGAPLVMVGAGMLTPEGSDEARKDGRLSVSWGQSLGEDCPARTGNACAEHLASHPVKVSYGGGTVILYQGQEATLNGLEIRILRAETGQGELLCDDADGGGESWVAIAREDTTR